MIPPTTLAAQINTAVIQLALALEQAQRDLATANARIRELEEKCGDPCKAPPAR